MRKSVFIFSVVAATLFACNDDEPIVEEAALAPFKTSTIESFVQAGAQISDELVALGRMLFYEERLSKAHDISCNTCHNLATFGVDNEAFSAGHRGQLGGRNSPTVYNASMQFVQFWDGRAKTVEEQALGPITNPVEMAMPEDGNRVVATLESMPAYVEAFTRLFPGEAQPVSMENIGKAIGAFERRLITPTRFHAFLAGDEKALTQAEQRGLKTFLEAGCASCHRGPGVGGTQYRKLGEMEAWPGIEDKGRRDVTTVPEDEHFFKVPTLLNVAKTAPYGHNGQTATLEEAVRNMAKYQLAKTLSEADIQSILSFLNALTGEIPTDFIQKPTLPQSTATTPEPDAS
ncbi:MAG: c-type cytochrome [Cystobacterineae bacterium]|nr:c-type cytochrome [Cystobacterineae bacterium]